MTRFEELPGARLALDPRAEQSVREVRTRRPVVVCVGSERKGLPAALLAAADAVARIPVRADGPESLNVAMAATVALYERTRMAGHA